MDFSSSRPTLLSATAVESLQGDHVFQKDQISVFENEKYIWLTEKDKSIQSIMDKAKPDSALMPVTNVMLLFRILFSNSARVLNLGLGGGAIERALPNDGITTVEINPDVIEIYQRYFQPSVNGNHKLVNSCALEFLQTNESTFQLIFSDLFVGNKPPEFIDQSSYFQLLSQALAADGFAMLNLSISSEQQLINYLSVTKKFFSHRALIDFNDYKNIVMVLSNRTIPSKAELEPKLKFTESRWQQMLNLIHIVD